MSNNSEVMSKSPPRATPATGQPVVTRRRARRPYPRNRKGRCPRFKPTPHAVEAIRLMIRAGIPRVEIAQALGIHRSTVWMIERKHLADCRSRPGTHH